MFSRAPLLRAVFPENRIHTDVVGDHKEKPYKELVYPMRLTGSFTFGKCVSLPCVPWRDFLIPTALFLTGDSNKAYSTIVNFEDRPGLA